MQIRSQKPSTSSASPVYSWEIIESRALRIVGPLTRVPSRRRTVSLDLRHLPLLMQQALAADGPDERAQEPFVVGHRTVQVLRYARNRGFLLQLTRGLYNAGRLMSYVQWLEEGIDALPEAFVLYDADDRLLIANQQYSMLYPTITGILRPGITFREIATEALERSQFRLSEDPETWLKRRLEFHVKGEGFFEQRLNNGRWIQLSERRTRSGGVASIRADITLLKDREEDLRRAMLSAESTSRSMSRFLATFSHEMRNGLNAVTGLAQLLALDAESASQRSNADLLLQSTHRLTNVLTDLLDYLKNEAIGVAVKLGPLSPKGLLETLRAELEPQAAKRQTQLFWEVSPDVPSWVQADSSRILQVLANLAGNALKHAQCDAVTIRLSVNEQMLRFEVEDEGVGIPEEHLRGLFEYFVQAGPQQASSTGLGLAICKQLVVAMGGMIGVESEPGRGSCFWFQLPLRIAPAPFQPPSLLPEREESFTPLRVGIIDDEALNRSIGKALVSRLGHHPFVFEEGIQISDRSLCERLDVLLLDLMMPAESGLEIAKRLRSHPDAAVSGLILIALTGNVLPDSLAACKEAGIDAILQKPLMLNELQHALIWAAGRERHVAAASPEIFFGAKVAQMVRMPQTDSHASLARLAGDIGPVRFAQSLCSARKLFAKCLEVEPANVEALRRLSHRIAGTAAQMGFDRLRDAARRVEALLGVANAEDLDTQSLQTCLNGLRREAREGLVTLDQQLLRSRRIVDGR